MYAEWTSLSPIIAANSNGPPNSVLTKFGGSAGRDVSTAVVKQLASNLGITQAPEPSILLSDDEVRSTCWVLAICSTLTAGFCSIFHLGELVHGCHLPWIVIAAHRTRNHQGLRECVLRMVDSTVASAPNQCAETNLRRPEFVCTENNQPSA